jgi:hypothetical protein
VSSSATLNEAWKSNLRQSAGNGFLQHLAASKFTYSRLNTWDTPSRAFERGMGYCDQQAAALKHIYDRLGIASRPVVCHALQISCRGG